MINIDQGKVYYEVKTCETPMCLINAHNLYIYIYIFLNTYNINISSFFYTHIIPYLTLRRFPLYRSLCFSSNWLERRGKFVWRVQWIHDFFSRLRLIMHFFVCGSPFVVFIHFIRRYVRFTWHHEFISFDDCKRKILYIYIAIDHAEISLSFVIKKHEILFPFCTKWGLPYIFSFWLFSFISFSLVIFFVCLFFFFFFFTCISVFNLRLTAYCISMCMYITCI